MECKRIFILNGHPARDTLSQALAMAYAKSAKAQGHDVRMAHLSDLAFDMDYENAGYVNSKPLEPALEQVMADIEWCEHLVCLTSAPTGQI